MGGPCGGCSPDRVDLELRPGGTLPAFICIWDGFPDDAVTSPVGARARRETWRPRDHACGTLGWRAVHVGPALCCPSQGLVI